MSELIVYCGPMFSSKSSRMFLDVERYRHAGREIFAFKPKVDGRYDSSSIVTHMGWKMPAIPITQGWEISKHIFDTATNPYQCLIVVDELFMIDGAADELVWLFRQGLDVTAASIDLTYDCKLFDEVSKILPWATRVEKCVAACAQCGHVARYTYRKVDDDATLLVGGSEMYEPRCSSCHPFVSIDNVEVQST